MKKRSNRISFLAGMLTMALILVIGGTVLAANGTLTNLDGVLVGGIRIVIDGRELHPTDVNGNPVSPMIYNGTTYLPVRAVATALDKAVYWDGPSYTVYLGKMDGQLEYPTVMLKDMTNIGTSKIEPSSKLTDNYGHTYSSAICFDVYDNNELNYEYLLKGMYSHFKGTLYMPEGIVNDNTAIFTVLADGRTIYTSPSITKTSQPVSFDINVTGYNDLKIVVTRGEYHGKANSYIYLADAGFYQ